MATKVRVLWARSTADPQPGDIIVLPDGQAKALAEVGHAELVDAKTPLTQRRRQTVETAMISPAEAASRTNRRPAGPRETRGSGKRPS